MRSFDVLPHARWVPWPPVARLSSEIPVSRTCRISKLTCRTASGRCLSPMTFPGTLLSMVSLKVFFMILGFFCAEGVEFQLDENIFPCIRCLPMGWNWSMCIVQKLHEQVACRKPRCCEMCGPHPRCGPSSLRLACNATISEYVHNLRLHVQASFKIFGFNMH